MWLLVLVTGYSMGSPILVSPEVCKAAVIEAHKIRGINSSFCVTPEGTIWRPENKV